MIDRSWKKQIIVDFVIVTTIYVVFTQSISSTSIDLINMILSFISLITSTISQINLKLKHVFSNDVIIYDLDVIDIINLIENFQNVFHDVEITVNISKKKWMSINLKSNVILKINKIYSLNNKNKKFMNVIFDKFHEQKKLHWIVQSIEFNYSTFVIWRNILVDEKKRVVMNIRDLNDIMKNDSYSLSLQTNVITKIVDSSYIFTMNVVDWFHQFNVQRKNRHKFIIVNHKKQKKFSVTLMSYKKSSSYVQRQTNKLLKSYKNFAKIYMNDILIHFRSLKKHLIHLHILFEMFKIKRINLIVFETFLIYSSMILLKQKIDIWKCLHRRKKSSSSFRFDFHSIFEIWKSF